ncbi:uncharacterized protein Bfra_007505 [Botrytis fragariae]|uniref:Uncharacterized protein n=1 Tax=Botrytis fragariae TaxID=1964551 RepID=A0A8H6EDN6_9HELO|nr:uncharacterized protein Bfra_007505 [Botrytis fragariae]KAF5868308.1 hypothetical protein Bfra_007505 [Botrytis fragariae]
MRAEIWSQEINRAVFLSNTSHTLSVAIVSAATVQERAGTGIVGSSTPCPTTILTTDGKLPNIATHGARCGGITDWYTRTSEGLQVYNSLQITCTSRTGSYLIPTSEFSTSGDIENYTSPTTFALS